MTRIAVQITHANPAATEPLSVLIFKPDAAKGEPDSLAREQSVNPGESIVIELSTFDAVVVAQRLRAYVA